MTGPGNEIPERVSWDTGRSTPGRSIAPGASCPRGQAKTPRDSRAGGQAATAMIGAGPGIIVTSPSSTARDLYSVPF